MTTPPRTRSLTRAALRALAPDQGVGVDAVSRAPLCALCGPTTGRTALGGRRGKNAVGDALLCAGRGRGACGHRVPGQTEGGATMTTFYHGGPAGLLRLLPSRDTGALSLADFGGEGVVRRDKVCVVTSYVVAAVFAALHPSGTGTVYEVEPIGALDPDPDFKGDGSDGVRSYHCDGAHIIRVIALVLAEAMDGDRADVS